MLIFASIMWESLPFANRNMIAGWPSNFVKTTLSLNNIFELGTPLAIGFALQIALKIKTNKIILYGFSDEYSDLYQKSELKSSKVLKDLNKISRIKLDGETDLILRTFKKQNSKIKITSINF